MGDSPGVQVDLATIEPDSLPAWVLWGAALTLAERIDAMLPKIEGRIQSEAGEYRDVARAEQAIANAMAAGLREAGAPALE